MQRLSEALNAVEARLASREAEFAAVQRRAVSLVEFDAHVSSALCMLGPPSHAPIALVVDRPTYARTQPPPPPPATCLRGSMQQPQMERLKYERLLKEKDTQLDVMRAEVRGGGAWAVRCGTI